MSIRWIILVMSLKRGRGFVVSKHNVSSHHCGKPTPSFDVYLEVSGDRRRGHCCDVHLICMPQLDLWKRVDYLNKQVRFHFNVQLLTEVEFVGFVFCRLCVECNTNNPILNQSLKTPLIYSSKSPHIVQNLPWIWLLLLLLMFAQ